MNNIEDNNKHLSLVDTSIYTFLMASAAILGLVKLTVFAKLLDPDEFGLYGLIIASYIYLMYAGSLGLNQALVKIGAMAYGRGDIKLTTQLRDIALVVGGVATFILAMIFAIAVGLLVEEESLSKTISLIGIFALASLEFNLVITYIRITQRFIIFSLFLLLKNLFVIVAAIYVAPYYGVDGIIKAEIVVLIVLFMFLLFFHKEKFSFSRISNSIGLTKTAIRQGFPMLSSLIIRNIPFSMDRWVIAGSLGLVSAGKYAFAMIIYQAAMVGLNFISTVLGARWLADYGRTRDLRSLLKKIIKVILLLTVISIIISIPFFFFLTPVLEIYFPQYIDTFWMLFIVYIGSVLLIISYLLDWIYIAASKEKILLKISVISLMLTSIMMFVGFHNQFNPVYYTAIFLIVRAIVLIIYIKGIVSIISGEKFNK